MIYLPDRQAIRMDGWYNGRQGAFQPIELPLSEFLRGLGISLEDCRQALEGMPSASTRTQATPMPAEHVGRQTVETPVTVPSDSRPVATQK